MEEQNNNHTLGEDEPPKLGGGECEIGGEEGAAEDAGDLSPLASTLTLRMIMQGKVGICFLVQSLDSLHF